MTSCATAITLWVVVLLAQRSGGSVAQLTTRPSRSVVAAVYSVRVRGEDGEVIGQLEVGRGEEAADAVAAFGVGHAVDDQQRATLVNAAREAGAQYTRRRALLYEREVEAPDGSVGTFRLWDGQSADDAVAAYVAGIGATAGPLVAALCRAAEETAIAALRPAACARVAARIPVTMADKELGVVEIVAGQEPADAVAAFARLHWLEASAHQALLDAACARARCRRRRAKAFSASPVRGPDGVELVDGGAPASLEVWNGDEPADAVYAFATAYGLSLDYARRLADETCGVVATSDAYLPRPPRGAVACGRTRGVIRRVPIRGPFGENKREVLVGELEVVDEAEAYDLAYAFAAARGCEGCAFYHQLAPSICEMTTCTRRRAVAWSLRIASADLDAFGWPPSSEITAAILQVWEGEQVVDGVRSLWFRRTPHLDDRAARRKLASAVCSSGAARPALCARAEEILAAADVESPKATRVTEFNVTRRFPKNGSLLDFGIVGWGGPESLQVLGVRNDSEADARGVGRGFKVRRVNGEDVSDAAHLRHLLNATPPPLNVTFQIVDDRDKWLPGRVVVYEGSTASDAVYAACRANELLQPNYTATGLQRDYLAAVCRAPYPEFLVDNKVPGCDAYAPREPLFELPLAYGGLGHTLRYYADLGDAPTAARAFCERLGNPRDCETDLGEMIAAQLGAVQKRRFSDTATPDGPDLYLALGVPRDASNETIVDAYERLAANLSEPYQRARDTMQHAEIVARRAAEHYQAAAMLARRANATMAVAAERARVATAELASRQNRALASLNPDSNASSAAAAAALEAVFEAAETVTQREALSALEKHDRSAATPARDRLDELVADGLASRREPPPPPKRRARRQQHDATVEITLAGRDLLDFRANPPSPPDWPTLADLVARARALVATLAGLRRTLDNCRRRAALARDLLTTATATVDETEALLDALDLDVPDIAMRAHALHVAFDTLADATNRDFYDRPCRPIFGACCVRDAPDGGLRITCGGGS